MNLQPAAAHRLGPRGKTAPLRCGVVRGKRVREQHFITPQYALVYVTAGKGWYRGADGEEHDLYPGCLFQRYPNQPHQVLLDGDILRAFIAVPSQSYELMRLCLPHKVDQPVHDIGIDFGLLEQFRILCDELSACPATDLFTMLGKMHQFIGNLFARTQNSAGHKRDPRMELACQILGSNFDERIQLDDVAKQLNMSNSAFRRAFRETYGLPPGEYRIRRRIEQALNLLTMGVAFSDISVQLGYTDVFAFSAQFKKYVGEPPSAVRKIAR